MDQKPHAKSLAETEALAARSCRTLLDKLLVPILRDTGTMRQRATSQGKEAAIEGVIGRLQQAADHFEGYLAMPAARVRWQAEERISDLYQDCMALNDALVQMVDILAKTKTPYETLSGDRWTMTRDAIGDMGCALGHANDGVTVAAPRMRARTLKLIVEAMPLLLEVDAYRTRMSKEFGDLIPSGTGFDQQRDRMMAPVSPRQIDARFWLKDCVYRAERTETETEARLLHQRALLCLEAIVQGYRGYDTRADGLMRELAVNPNSPLAPEQLAPIEAEMRHYEGTLRRLQDLSAEARANDVNEGRARG